MQREKSPFEAVVLVARRAADGKFAQRWDDGRASGYEWVDSPIRAHWVPLQPGDDPSKPRSPAYYLSPATMQDDPQWRGVSMVALKITASVQSLT